MDHLFASDDERYARLVEMQEAFGSDDNDVILVCQSEDWFAPQVQALLRLLVARVEHVEGLQSVTWLGSLPIFEAGKLPRLLMSRAGDRELALEHALVKGRLLSSDASVMLIFARLNEDIQLIDGIEEVVSELRDIAKDTSETNAALGVRVMVTGIPPIRVDVFRLIHRDQMLFTALGGLLCGLLALFLFRSLGAVLATTLPPLIGALWAMGFIALIGYSINLMSAVLQMVVIEIGLTDSIHLVMDMRVSRAKGLGPVEASADAIRRLGMPCLLTSITTAVGFGSLALAGVPIIRDFGVVAALGILLSFSAILTSMPLIAACFPSVGVSPELGTRRGLGGLGESLASRCLALVERFPRLVAASGVLALGALFLQALDLQPENRLTEALPKGESYAALRLCEEVFGGVLPNYVVLEWEPGLELSSSEVMGAMQGVHELLGGFEELSRPLSCLDLFDALPGGRANLPARALIPRPALERFVREDLRQALVVVAVADGPSSVLVPLFDNIQAGLAQLRELHPRIEFELTGTDYVARSNVNGMIRDLAISLAFAALLIFGTIALEFRSLRLGLISLLPNLFPLALVGGVLQLLDRPLQMSSAVLFTVLLGLAVDDTIHFLWRYRRERQEVDDAALAVQRAYFSVGRAIVITTVVLVLGFGTLALSAIPLNQLFAGLACLGMLGALVGDLIFLPAMLLVFDKRPRAGAR